MTLSHQAEAILLLTARFGRPTSDAPRPLGVAEWGRFALWLKTQGAEPEDLLQNDWRPLLREWSDPSIGLERIDYLLGRAGALALSLEKWERAGIWVVVRSDIDYPSRLKERLRGECPPFFFGCGSRRLLGQSGIAIVGSRNANQEDLEFTSRLGGEAARQGLSVVSGGARGVDEAAISGAMASEGTAVGVLSADLLRASTSPKFRSGLLSGSLTLVTPFNPEAGFTVGNAMARNKYIYCLADAAIVIATDAEKGGTWSGAIEALKRRWVPLWVRTDAPGGGNALLLERGAQPLPGGELQLAQMAMSTIDHPSAASRIDPSGPRRADGISDPDRLAPNSAQDVEGPIETNAHPYHAFLREFKRLSPAATTTQQLSKLLHIEKAALARLLVTAVRDGHVTKLKKPVRYVWTADFGRQTALFNDSMQAQ